MGDQSVDVPVDLIVPTAAYTGGGRRGARLGAHGKRAARLIPGLEASLVGHAPRTIHALEPDDARSITAEVAGPAALRGAKAHKIHDRARSERADRMNDKDASDALRLMQSTDPAAVAATLDRLRSDPTAGEVTTAAIDHLHSLFGVAAPSGSRWPRARRASRSPRAASKRSASRI